MRQRLLTTGLLLTMLGAASTSVSASIVNGDFETGDLTGWTLFTYSTGGATGSTGTTDVDPFDTNGDSVASNAARFQVGQVPPGTIGGGTPRVGGGISQSFTSAAGTLNISLDVASTSTSNNADGGLYELLLDGIVVDMFDAMSIDVGEVERDTLSAAVAVAAGAHELSIRMTRGYGIGATPRQHVDNVVVSLAGIDVPEPGVLALLAPGLLLVARRRRRNA